MYCKRKLTFIQGDYRLYAGFPRVIVRCDSFRTVVLKYTTSSQFT